MKDIVIIREEKNYDETVFNYIRNKYDSSVIDFDSKKAEYTVASDAARMIIAFVEDISASSIVELRRMLMYFKNVHFCLLGSHFCIEKFDEFMEKENVHCVEIPLPLQEFQLHFEEILEKNIELNSLGKDSENRTRSILLVDDDPVCLRNMMNWLKNFYQVAVVKSGAACISFLGKTRPDLILLDYEMPVCNGVQTLEMIRSEKEYADIPVMFLTGVSDTEKVKEALKLKPQGYILKNTDRMDFLNKVNAVFGK